MTATTVIELKGHIIDSLTLAKVIDVIQTARADYKMNFIDVGYGKTDFSTAHITVSLPDEAQLNALLKNLATYGAKPIEAHTAGYAPCPDNGVAPENALLIESSLKRIFVADEWVPLETAQEPKTVVVYDPATKTAGLKPTASLNQGEFVVTAPSNIPNHLLLK